VSDAALAILARTGFEWAASDEAVLAAALERRDGELRNWPAALHRPYRVETGGGPIAMVFRDRALSDLIGFTYARWDPAQAADDFLRRVGEAGRSAQAGPPPLVTVILDGENCWEFYPDDGRAFLSAVYERLQSETDIEPVTVSEAVEPAPAAERLERVPVGSWIRADLGIWVGNEEKNRAWEELGAARRAVAGAMKSNREAAERALEELYVAEGSDWFWWYGDDHPSAHRGELDRLFRARLIRAYAFLGIDAPRSLEGSLREAAPGANDGAAVYRPAGAAGTAHRVSGAVRSIRFETDGKTIRIRVELARAASEESGASVAVVLAGPPGREARAQLGKAGEGPVEWSEGSPAGEAPVPGTYTVGEAVEIRIPTPRPGPEAGDRVRFRVVLRRGGEPEEVAPLTGWFQVGGPGSAPRAADSPAV